MSKLRKCLALSASDWLLIAQAWILFVAVKVGLSFLRLQKLLRIIQWTGRPRRDATGQGELSSAIPERVAYCVDLAARLPVPDSTCLRRALVLYALLTHRGFDARVLIGAARATDDKLEAHAWLECEGKILLGEPAPGHYSTLCELPGSMVSATNPQAQAHS